MIRHNKLQIQQGTACRKFNKKFSILSHSNEIMLYGPAVGCHEFLKQPTAPSSIIRNLLLMGYSVSEHAPTSIKTMNAK
jgi:hypothetical protein